MTPEMNNLLICPPVREHPAEHHGAPLHAVLAGREEQRDGGLRPQPPRGRQKPRQPHPPPDPGQNLRGRRRAPQNPGAEERLTARSCSPPTRLDPSGPIGYIPLVLSGPNLKPEQSNQSQSIWFYKLKACVLTVSLIFFNKCVCWFFIVPAGEPEPDPL